MTHYSVADLLIGKPGVDANVVVKGWVRTRRDSKAGISFINLSDGSNFHPVQIVVPNSLANYESEILKLTPGCSLIASGRLVESRGKGQKFEIQAESVEVVGWVDEPETYPMQQKHHTMEYLREVAHLRPRTNVIGAVTRVRHHAAQAIHQFFHEKGFYWVNTPIITASDCEGAGEMFRVSTLDMMNPPINDGKIDFTQDFFGKESFLTVSGQLNLECYSLAMSNVYTFGPTFRAENSNTSRHLAEFWMIEPEIAFADLNDDADLAVDLLKFVFKSVLDHCEHDIDFFVERIEKEARSRMESVVNSEFERIDYTDAIKILDGVGGQKFEYPIQWGQDMQTEHERFLSEQHFKKPVIVMNYPKQIKAFYMKLNDDSKTVAAMDVLVPGVGEIIGGSQREERLDVLDQRLEEMQLEKEAYEWYRDLRRYGSVPHAGFGLGFERLISYITGLSNVRDAIPFPRTPNNVSF